MTCLRNIFFTLMFLRILVCSAQAEVSSINFAHQNGWAYLPFYVMKELHLVEKRAKELRINLKTDYKNLGSAGVIRDAMIAKQVQFGALGVPTLVILADKTFDNKSLGMLKIVSNIVSLPMDLNTREDVTRVCDLKGKIALPTIKTSVQAVTLQMAADQQCRNPYAVDDKTVSMTHPDAMQEVLTGQISSHFTSPPFQEIELKEGKGKIKKLLNSYEVLRGQTSFILLTAFDKFAEENPTVYKAVTLAFEDALNWINEDKKRAAQLYIKSERPKESLEEITAQLSDPDVLFASTPNRIAVYAKFMHKIGTVKRDLDWKTMSMSNLHDKQGS